MIPASHLYQLTEHKKAYVSGRWFALMQSTREKQLQAYNCVLGVC